MPVFILIRSMRSGSITFILALCTLATSAQNPWMRMQPEDWFALESVQKGWELVKEDPQAYWSYVIFEEGRLAMVPGSQGAMYYRSPDLRVMIDSLGQNLSKSHNLGFNVQAKHFFWNDRCFAAGGWGYWNYHAQLIEFVRTTGEWELLSVQNPPQFISEKFSFWDGENSRLIAIDNSALETAEGSLALGVYSLMLGKEMAWKLEGQINPSFANHFEYTKLRSFDLKDYFILVGMHKTWVLRKNDLTCVFTNALNDGMLEGPNKTWRSFSGYRHETTKNGVLSMRYTSKDGRVLQERSWDIHKAFEESKGQAMPLFTPVNFEGSTQSNIGDGPSKMWAALILAIAFGATGYFVGKRNRTQALEESDQQVMLEPVQHDSAPAQDPPRMSALTQQFLDLEASSLDTAELNVILALTDDLSEETKRARRAQAIRKVNLEYELWFQQALILRTKDKLDRRRTIYVIQRHSDNA